MLKNKLLKAFAESKPHNTAERILMCAFIMLAGTFYFYDYYQPFSDAARLIISLLIFITWFYCGLFAGKDKQWGVLIFSYLYMAVPYVYTIFYNSRDNVRNYSKHLSLVNKIADMLFNKPLAAFADKLDTSPQVLMCVVLVGTVTLFFIGLAIIWRYEKHNTVKVTDKKVQASEKTVKAEKSSEPVSLKDFLDNNAQ